MYSTVCYTLQRRFDAWLSLTINVDTKEFNLETCDRHSTTHAFILVMLTDSKIVRDKLFAKLLLYGVQQIHCPPGGAYYPRSSLFFLCKLCGGNCQLCTYPHFPHYVSKLARHSYDVPSKACANPDKSPTIWWLGSWIYWYTVDILSSQFWIASFNSIRIASSTMEMTPQDISTTFLTSNLSSCPWQYTCFLNRYTCRPGWRVS